MDEEQKQAHHSRKGRPGMVLFVFLIFVTGSIIGFGAGVRSLVVDAEGDVRIQQVLELYSQTRSKEVSFDQFWKVWDTIKEKHVDRPVNDVDLFYGALQGLVHGIGDPYSEYFPPKKAKAFVQDLSGEFEGIGAEIGIRDDQLKIVAPLHGSPAEKAGLLPGDTVLAIDGEETFGVGLEQAVTKIRGKKGTTVILTITRNGMGSAEDFSVVRDTINLPTVVYEEEEQNIAYVRISQFNEKTWSEFDSTVREVLLQNPRGIILDLRRNPGGFLETAIDVASEWVVRGNIVEERFGEDVNREHKTRGKHRLVDIPTIVLVDEGSASASEIVAGALQDHGSATIIGMQTFGKGSVQEFEPFADGSAIKLTVAKWFTPLGRGIDRDGITPDIVLEAMFEEVVDEQGETTFVDLGRERARVFLTQ
jgi:carboxyl-terminal processing protease